VGELGDESGVRTYSSEGGWLQGTAARLTVILTVLDDLSLLTERVELSLVDDGLFSLQSFKVLDAADGLKSRSASGHEKHEGTS